MFLVMLYNYINVNVFPFVYVNLKPALRIPVRVVRYAEIKTDD